jgi:hypothetical protein
MADRAWAWGRTQTGKVKEENKMHAGSIADMQLSVDGTHFVTASFDNLAKLVDAQTLEVRRSNRRTARCPGCCPQHCQARSWPACTWARSLQWLLGAACQCSHAKCAHHAVTRDCRLQVHEGAWM